jgi:hypothetical protein
MSADLKEKRKEHNKTHTYNQTAGENRLAKGLYSSSNVITAYKIGFAMMYGLRIDFPVDQISTA